MWKIKRYLGSIVGSVKERQYWNRFAGEFIMSRFSPKNIMIYMIRLYQKYISPMKRTKCPYIPTCSQYGLEAIQKYGALKGGLLAVWRILRCNPFSHGGYDPVP